MNCNLKNSLILVLGLMFICSTMAMGQVESKAQSLSDIISIEFVDANIHDVIHVLATAQNLNYIIGQNVTGTITVKLDNVTFQTALNAVVTSNGYRYRIQENLLRIDTADKFAEEDAAKKEVLAMEQLVTVVFHLKYINGKDIIELIKTQLTERGKAIPMVSTIQGGYSAAGMSSGSTFAKGSRSASKPQDTVDKIIVIDTVDSISKVKKLLDELDVMPQQILIESKLVESESDVQTDLGIRWDFLSAGPDGAGGMRLGVSGISKEITDTISNTFGLTGTDTQTRELKLYDVLRTTDATTGETTETLQQSTPLLSPTSSIPEYLKQNPMKPDFNEVYDHFRRATTDDGGVGMGLERSKIDTGNTSLSTTLGRISSATLSASDFNVILNALKTKDGVEVISNPSILTLNNHEATILVGERYPILKSSVSDVGTVVQTFDRYEPVGVQLQVLPRILHNDFVSMIIKPAVTTIGATVGTASLQVNRINTREASTQLIVRSGDTIVIGGLISNREENDNSTIPFLGKIPVLGKLFSYRHENAHKINLTVFVTPTIISSPENIGNE